MLVSLKVPSGSRLTFVRIHGDEFADYVHTNFAKLVPLPGPRRSAR